MGFRAVPGERTNKIHMKTTITLWDQIAHFFERLQESRFEMKRLGSGRQKLALIAIILLPLMFNRVEAQHYDVTELGTLGGTGSVGNALTTRAR